MEAQRQIISNMVQLQRSIQDTKTEIVALKTLNGKFSSQSTYDNILKYLEEKLDYDECQLMSLENIAELIFKK